MSIHAWLQTSCIHFSTHNQTQRNATMCGSDGGKTETPEQQAHYRACTEMDTQICIKVDGYVISVTLDTQALTT